MCKNGLDRLFINQYYLIIYGVAIDACADSIGNSNYLP